MPQTPNNPTSPPLTPEQALQTYFTQPKFRGFRGPQREIISHILSNQHALVIMPTGMGKSLCYQIPALITPGLTLVLSPLIALMKDQVDALRQKNIHAAYINSSLTRSQREQRYANIAAGKYNILYVTPERFRKPEFLDVIAQRQIPFLAVDEAHCISEWGHDFRPDYTRLAEIRAQLNNPTTIALTATATPDVQTDIIKQLGLTPDQITLFHEGIDRPNLTLTVQPAWGEDEKLEHILQIQKQNPGSGIVYFTLIKTLEQFSELLRKKSIPHLAYHGSLEREPRKRIQEKFMAGKNKLVLATNAFGMGIDKEDIRFVTHADIPGSMESYYQEIGRAGRDGLPSQCTLLYDEHDLTTQMQFIQWSNPDVDFYRRLYNLIEANPNESAAFGLEWLREKLVHKQRHDRRLETALTMLERYAVIEPDWLDNAIRLTDSLPPELLDPERLEQKLKRDQLKLYALLQYIKHTGDRKQYIHDYFGLPYNPPS